MVPLKYRLTNGQKIAVVLENVTGVTTEWCGGQRGHEGGFWGTCYNLNTNFTGVLTFENLRNCICIQLVHFQI
jgi:hypothetical protein